MESQPQILSRRLFVAGVAAGTAGLLVERMPGAWAAPARAEDDPFTLGVASGDPTPTGVVLWTRLAPRPLEPDGGMPGRVVPVQWEVATGPRLGGMVRRGEALAHPRFAHSVHVEVEGLEPGRTYWYRFRAGGGIVVTCPERTDKRRTILGDTQRRWLLDGLDRSQARWNVLAQQVVMAELDVTPGPGRSWGSDAWDGYAADRGRVLRHLWERQPANPVVLTGDVHAFFVNDLRLPGRGPDARWWPPSWSAPPSAPAPAATRRSAGTCATIPTCASSTTAGYRRPAQAPRQPGGGQRRRSIPWAHTAHDR
jgi:phosphodiesterase/alkaline phosphatase D-like protein